MSREPSASEVYTLSELIVAWERGEVTVDEIIQRWPHSTLKRKDALRDIVHVIIALRMRIAAIDGIGDW